ncbi:MAG: EAL domain-containing protein, partial [Gammaproteobacteria bacterium]|nr:EAL domain-containing protein [Gammaproteobacteria bacterium]
ILREIKALLDQFSLPPNLLTFEITEDVAIANLTVASTFMSELQRMGCYTALDDFGVGYSSFSYLRELPVDIVKIDGSFVRNAETDPVNLAMVKAMNEVAHALGKKTVAEYVENQEIFELLKTMGVDYVQGYHIGRPVIINFDTMTRQVKKIVG